VKAFFSIDRDQEYCLLFNVFTSPSPLYVAKSSGFEFPMEKGLKTIRNVSN